jgi:hypothetical protein
MTSVSEADFQKAPREHSSFKNITARIYCLFLDILAHASYSTLKVKSKL